MSKLRCDYCGERRGKRYCPSLDKIICPICCADSRLTSIPCPEDCRYLEHERYQQEHLREKEIRSALESLHHSEDNDIFRISNEAPLIAYQFEIFFADCYIKEFFQLTDLKIKNTLIDLYLAKFHGKPFFRTDEFSRLTMEVYGMLEDEYEKELVGKVVLRILISIDAMTGGPFGTYGYLNYLRNNLHPSADKVPDGFIMETRDGEKKKIFYKDIKR